MASNQVNRDAGVKAAYGAGEPTLSANEAKQRLSHNFQLKRGYRATYTCTYCGVEMVGDPRAHQPCKNADLYVINEELNNLQWEPPLNPERQGQK